MIPYLLLLFYVVSIASFGRRYGSGGVERLSLLVCGLLLTLFAGLRDKTVGTDTGNYVNWLQRITTLEEALAYKNEVGYSFIVLLSNGLSGGYAIMLTIIALIVVSCYLFAIVRLTERYETAIFLFVTLGSYTFFFNGARQGMAAAFCFLALPWLLERKALPYFLLIGVATLFHKTALIAIPLYFLARASVSWRTLLIVIVSGATLAAFITVFSQFAATFIDDKYAMYGQEHEGGGHVKVAFLLAQGIILLSFSNKIADPKGFYPRLLNIYLLGLVPALASVIGGVNPSGILRLTSYFEHTAIILWSLVFLSFKNEGSRVIVSAAFLLVALAYFVMTTSSFSNLMPYKINSEMVS